MTKLKLGRYKHYKGGNVQVLHIAKHSETLKKYVVYKTLYTNRTRGKRSIWVRPIEMFTEQIQLDGKPIPRFKYLRKA